jgi:homoserine dehydrogenase
MSMVYASSLASANRPLHVLKFGGSVLEGEDALHLAVREIARTRAQGFRVLAVTSAFRGVTERLLAAVTTRFEAPPPEAVASLLATGESASAAFLSLALDAASIGNELLDPDRIRLTVRGSFLDAEPVDVDVEAIDKALGIRGVAVLPGFYGRRPSGGIALLGRGGSDLTALFVAERLGAEECRLVKDVGGLYTEDPALGGAPQRYRQASWEELLRVGGGVVQKKAVEFARRHRLSFTLASPLGDRRTRIGPVTELEPERVAP